MQSLQVATCRAGRTRISCAQSPDVDLDPAQLHVHALSVHTRNWAGEEPAGEFTLRAGEVLMVFLFDAQPYPRISVPRTIDWQR